MLRKKGYSGEDIHEGKMSLIVIHALKSLSECDRERLFEILQMKTNDSKLIAEAIELLKKSNSIDFARDVASDLVEEAWKNVKDAIPNSKAKENLEKLGKFFIKRKV